jgi:signal transduction histidine kinase
VIAWHRIQFTLDAAPPGRLALDLGAIAWSDEVYVNGRRIGGTGRFDRLPRLGQLPRLYPLPDDALRTGSNVIAIRIRGVPFGINGILATRIGIGDELALTRAGTESSTQFFEGLLLGFLVVSWLVVAFFPRRGRAGRATLFLLATITFALLMLFVLSVTCREAGISPEVSANVLVALLMASGTIYWAFITTILRGQMPLKLTVPLVVELVLAVIVLVWPAMYAVVIVVGMVIGHWAFGFLCWLIFGAIRARVPGAVPLAFSCVLPAIALVVMMLAPNPFLGGLPLAFWGLASAIAGAVLALTRHVHEMNRQVQRATDYSLEAHTRERGRLARDLHDGLGQMLALLKLQMQRMSKKHQGEPVQQTFEESAEQVTITLDELRRISRDLRPAPLQDRTFGEAVREYAAAMARSSGLEVVAEGEY